MVQVKRNSYDVIAYIAHIRKPEGMKEPEFRMLKLEYMRTAIDLVLQPLKDMAECGKVGEAHWQPLFI